MSDDCRTQRPRIAAALIDDLPGEDARQLDAHLEHCAPCRRERDAMARTLRILAAAHDVPTPRRFALDVADVGSGRGGPAGRALLIAASVLAVFALGWIAGRLHVEAQGGVLLASLGAPAEERLYDAIAARLFQEVDLRVGSETRALATRLRSEMDEGARALRQERAGLLEASLAAQEARLAGRIDGHALHLRGALEDTLAGMQQAGWAERRAELARFGDRVRRLEADGARRDRHDQAVAVMLARLGARP